VTLRVGYDCAPLYLNRAGEFRYASRLLAELRGRDDVAVVGLTPPARRPRTLAQRISLQATVQAVYYPLLLGRQARRGHVELVHHPRHLVPPTLGLSAPSVITIHDVLPLREPKYFSPAIMANFRALAPRAARRAALVLTGSEHSRQEISELLAVDPRRIVVTPYGVDRRFAPSPPRPEWLRERFGIQGRYVLCVGTVEPRKNLVGAVRAFAALSARRSEISLVAVGAHGWGSPGLEAEIALVRAPVVQTGFVSDDELVWLLGGAACFLYPSWAEGFGFPPLEAMACGTPVVVSDRTSLPEVVADAGLLVDPADVQAMAAALDRVLGSAALAETMRTRGLQRARSFTWSRCAAQTVDAYRRVLAP
jgi:glycosyltransferase involved in cell wall biosynthesis